MLHRLRRAGLRSATFSYSVALESFEAIVSRLRVKLEELSHGREDYVVVGHSLGGVLLRAAIHALPMSANRPHHVFLLGSPIGSARLAARFQNNPVYRSLTGDCGQLLASATRMAAVASLHEPTTSIVGVRGLSHRRSPFGEETNDGVVSIGEVSAPWLTRQFQVPVVHTLLPASRHVAAVILRAISESCPS